MFRILPLLLVVLIGVPGTGCAGSSEYDAEPDPTADRQSASIGLPTDAGEADEADVAAAAPVPNPSGAVGRTDLLNATKLQAVPSEVRTAFNRDFPDGGITSIYRLDAATGLTLYEINFLRNRRAEDVIYRPNGTPITRTPLQDGR